LVTVDGPLICRVCTKTPANDWCEVEVAGNGLIAMEMASRETYDLYFSDIRTPAMNGMEFYRFLDSIDSDLSRRIIFTTGDVMSPDVKEFLAKNHNPFLPEPFTADELRSTVRKASASSQGRPGRSCHPGCHDAGQAGDGHTEIKAGYPDRTLFRR
jgi:CheY-like chemotaxis protein